MTIEEMRIRIDELDRQLVELLSERARAAQMICPLATSGPQADGWMMGAV